MGLGKLPGVHPPARATELSKHKIRQQRPSLDNRIVDGTSVAELSEAVALWFRKKESHHCNTACIRIAPWPPESGSYCSASALPQPPRFQ